MDTKKYNLLPCPFCGGNVSKCDESPLYGGSIMHDETECLFKNNLLFHGNINDRWNSRPIEDALQARIDELEKTAIVWHRYPEEKPERPMGTLVNRLVDWFTMLILYKDENGNRFVGRDTYHWWEDDEPAFESEMDESITVIGFAYLPAPPEEEK